MNLIDLTGKKIVAITGAGISKSAGIETFRDNGIYDKDPDLKYKLRPDTFETDPEFLYNYHNDFKERIKDKKPTLAHELIAKHNISVITQNIDDLHEKAGSLNVLHIHGDLNSSRCLTCRQEYEKCFLFGDLCPCGGSLRHNIILFKESLLKADKALKMILEADVLIQIGSSGMIYPVAGWVKSFKEGKDKLAICVNKEKPDNSRYFDYVLLGDCDNIVSRLLK